MSVNIEKIATWTYFLAVVAVVVALVYGTLHLALGTASSAELAALETKIDTLETKMDKRFDHLESILVSGKLDAKQEMINHLSTAHAVTPSD